MKQKTFSNYKLLAVCNGKGLLYHKGKLYTQNFETENKPVLFTAIYEGKQKLLSKFRLTERMLRLEPRSAFSIENGVFLLSCNGLIYCVDMNKGCMSIELKLRNRMHNPLQFIMTNRGTVLFGEYFSNNSHEDVKVFERKDGVWSEIYSFPENTIYHIHGFAVDHDRIFVLTGDKDKESAIWYTDDYFKTLKVAVSGEQKYRSCVAFPFQDGLVYATDSPLVQNYLFYLHAENGQWCVKEIGKMPGPCIYGTCSGNKYYFATSVEPNAKYEDTMRYRFTYELGEGVQDRYVHIIELAKDGITSDVLQLKKDIWPMLLFQFGNTSFPNSDAGLYITPTSVKEYDGKTIIIE